MSYTTSLTYANSRGQMTASRNEYVNESTEYDAAGRTKKSTYGSRVFEYEYYWNDSLAVVKNPLQRIVRTCYDTLGRIKWLSGALGAADCTEATNPATQANSYASGISYAPHGGMRTLLLGNGRYEETCYDNQRLQMQVKRLGSALSVGGTCGQSTANDLWRMELGYLDNVTGNNGNVTSQKIGAPAGGSEWWEAKQSYGYDGVNRLTAIGERSPVNAANPDWSTTFSVDAYGNMAMSGTAVKAMAATSLGQYNAAKNRIVTTQAGATIGYDNAGNMTNHAEMGAAVYDAENMLVSVTKGAAIETYQYDGKGRRSKRCRGANCVEYIYDASGQLAMESGAIGGSTSGVSYRTDDHLGSTRVETSGSSGAVTGRWDYQPFGDQIDANATYSGRQVVEGYNPLVGASAMRFTGKERDAETGLDYFGARYLSSAQGRFTSPDEWQGGAVDPFTGQQVQQPGPLPYADIRLPQSLNKYAYVMNNPLRYTDPDGHCIWDVCVVEAVAVTAIVVTGLLHYGSKVAQSIQDIRNQPVYSQVQDDRKAPPNPAGQQGAQDHQEEVKNQRDKAQANLKPGETVLDGKTIQGVDSTRRPDVQVVGQDGKVVSVVEVERRPNSKRHKERQAEYDKLGVPHTTVPLPKRLPPPVKPPNEQ